MKMTLQERILYATFSAEGGITKSELYRKIHGERFGLSNLNQTIKILEESKQIVIMSQPGLDSKGRLQPHKRGVDVIYDIREVMSGSREKKFLGDSGIPSPSELRLIRPAPMP
jgi:predicted transcriptional regulator